MSISLRAVTTLRLSFWPMPGASRRSLAAAFITASAEPKWAMSALRRRGPIPGVSASKDGVWVAYATGMLGQIEHLHAIGLTEVPTSHAATTNSIRVVAVNNMVWAIDAMAGKVECLDQQTGKSRVGWADSEAMVIAGDSQGLYLGSVSGLSVLVVDRRCQ